MLRAVETIFEGEFSYYVAKKETREAHEDSWREWLSVVRPILSDDGYQVLLSRVQRHILVDHFMFGGDPSRDAELVDEMYRCGFPSAEVELRVMRQIFNFGRYSNALVLSFQKRIDSVVDSVGDQLGDELIRDFNLYTGKNPHARS